MDKNDKHGILQDPSDFQTPNTKYNAYEPNSNNTNEIQNQNIQPSLDNQIIYDNNILNNLFDNPEEEILFKYDEIDEEELGKEYDNGVNNMNNQEDHQTEN